MGNFYLDSSALVKYYVPEAGSAWMRELIDARTEEQEWEHEISTSQLTVVEAAAAVEKRRRMKEIGQSHRVRTLARLSMDYRRRYAIARVGDAIIESAVDLTSRHLLRAYDAVQLATALQLNQTLCRNRLPPLIFVSADRMLCQAAEAEGLAAVNPGEAQSE